MIAKSAKTSNSSSAPLRPKKRVKRGLVHLSVLDGYYNYTRNERFYNKTQWETTTVSEKGVTGWTIGNTTYAPGDKVTITSSQTATAVIGSFSTQTTTYEVVYKVRELYDDYLDGQDSSSAKGTVESTVYENGWTQVGDPTEISRTPIS